MPAFRGLEAFGPVLTPSAASATCSLAICAVRKKAYSPTAAKRKYAIWKCVVVITSPMTRAIELKTATRGATKWRSTAQKRSGVRAMTNILPSCPGVTRLTKNGASM